MKSQPIKWSAFADKETALCQRRWSPDGIRAELYWRDFMPHSFAKQRGEIQMRSEMDKAKLETFMAELGQRVRGAGTIYLTGGATALWYGWRAMTIDVDIKPAPEPAGLFEALAQLKNELDINIELAAPDQFIPAVPGWQDRSIFIARHGSIDFYHYDLYGQALAKLSRGHLRDLQDVRSMLQHELITIGELREKFAAIEPQIIRYPALDADVFRANVNKFCDEH